MHLLSLSAEIKYSIISCITMSIVLMLTPSNLAFSTVASNTTTTTTTPPPSNENASITIPGTNSSISSLLPSSILPNASSLNLNLSNSTLALMNNTPLSEQFASMDNLTSTSATGTGGSFVNDTQLSGTENITLVANFSSKPVGLETDYLIVGKPLILVNDVPLNYEYVNDTSDEITITDILISMRATVKLDNSTTSALPVYVKVFSNPVNTTQNADGSKTIINSPNLVENIEIGGVIFSDAATTVTLYPNGTGTLKAHN
jgi:hypothetical protein